MADWKKTRHTGPRPAGPTRIHPTIRVGSSGAHGSRQLSSSPLQRKLALRRPHTLSPAWGLMDLDLECALVRLGSLLLLRGTRDLVQRVLHSIAEYSSGK